MKITNLGFEAEVAKPPTRHKGPKPACLIEHAGQKILIDVGPDLFQQLDTKKIERLTAILLTHAHSDAIRGIPALNRFYQKLEKEIDIYIEKETWLFIQRKWSEKSLTQYKTHFIKPRTTFKIGDISIRPLRVAHAGEIFPTLAFNFDRVFVYCSDGYLGKAGYDEYERKYWSNNYLAILDGAYWDRQVGRNHTAVLPYFNELMSLNNRYTYFTGYGNQWPRQLSKARAILRQKLKEYKKEHPECKVKEVGIVKAGQQFHIAMNKLLVNETRPSIDTLINNLNVLRDLLSKELVSVHQKLHLLFRSDNRERVLEAHCNVVKEIYRRGLKHQKIDELDIETYKIIGKEIRIFDIHNNLEDTILLKSNVIKVVGSSIQMKDAHDVDVISLRHLEKLVRKLFSKYNLHLISGDQTHGDVVNLYDLVLQKKDLQLTPTSLPCFTQSYEVSKWNSKLSMTAESYIIEPYITGEYEVVVNKHKKLIYERVLLPDGREVITDLLAFRRDNFLNECLFNRQFFMIKKWISNESNKLLVHRWVVKREYLFKFLSKLRKSYRRLIIRPALSRYYDGKFLIDFKKDTLKPLEIFKPLKATGTAYHEMEFFSIDEAWETFGKYYVKEEGKIRCEMKVDGLRCILQYDGKNPLIYFEDAKKNRSKYLSTLSDELKTLGPIILDSELMEKDPDTGTWKSRHDLLLWAVGKKEEEIRRRINNVYVLVFDVLYTEKEGDLHNKSLEERLKVLEKLRLPKHFLKCPGHWVSSESSFRAAVKKYSKMIGSDGSMIKAASSKYPLSGRTSLWAKYKVSVEIDTIVLERFSVKSTFNYRCGYKIPQDQIDKYTPTFKLNNVIYGVIGKSFNTKIRANPGQILTVRALEVKKEEVKGKIKYTWFHPNPLYLKPEKKEPDSAKDLERYHQAGPTIKSFLKDFEILEKAKIEPTWTIKKGDKFRYCIQTHCRGLLEYQIKNLPLKRIGIDHEWFQPTSAEYKILKSILDVNWKKGVKQATETPSSTLLQKWVDKIETEDLTQSQIKALSKVGPISIHQDFRYVIEGKDYFEGGHWVTPGNQFKVNRLLKLREGKYCQFLFKAPHKKELERILDSYDIWATVEPVVRGSASWTQVGAGKPYIVPPKGVGATAKNWAFFYRIEYSKGVAGRQTSPHGKHFREFFFKGKILSGRVVWMYAPLGKKRVWLTMRPKKQPENVEEFLSEKYSQDWDILEQFYDLVIKSLVK